jgi:hypothetical protein
MKKGLFISMFVLFSGMLFAQKTYNISNISENEIEVVLNFKPTEDLVLRFYSIRNFFPIMVLDGKRYYTILGKTYNAKLVDVMDRVATQIDFYIENENNNSY